MSEPFRLLRSLLFVPGDAPRKVARAAHTDADLVVFDLEDAVAPSRKAEARRIVSEAISATADPVAVRVNAINSELIQDDLMAVMPARPAAIMLPKAESGRDVTHLAALLAVHETEASRKIGETKIIALAMESATALFGLGSYAVGPRLVAMAWGVEDLATDLGATRRKEPSGVLTGSFATARTLVLAGAVAAGAQPIDTVYADFADTEGLKAEADAAAADGFLGKLAIHPAQVPVINAAFTPSAAAVAAAQRVMDAFAAEPGTGVVAMNGRMVDEAHRKQAERVLARAKAASTAA